ncbi:MAG: UDP-N-acetylmuramate dehydrogenase [Bryobacteraceae bacterium]|nr:UDP-N-acetylmuramate dehydrogenase [Bryobacteraceae bacterium]
MLSSFCDTAFSSTGNHGEVLGTSDNFKVIKALALDDIADLRITRNAPLRDYTRFGLGGPADLLIDAPDEVSFSSAWQRLAESGVAIEVIGGGSNLVVSDEGFRGVVLRYTADFLRQESAVHVSAGAGAILQNLVDLTIRLGLHGIHTMTGIPGWVGGAIYGNAGAYGRSIDLSITRVRFFDGARIREFSNPECGFRYRESTFKDHKGWIVLSTELELLPADTAELRDAADSIRSFRDAKYPPSMKCAGSIFKNLIFSELPESVQAQVDPKVVREGKVPSAWFLERAGAKGLRNGDIHVADYHANLIYNAGDGTALEVQELIGDLKARVRSAFGFEVEEEVQYIGF